MLKSASPLLASVLARTRQKLAATPMQAADPTAVLILSAGALAVGALAIGSLAIGRARITRARLDRVEIDNLVIRRLTVIETAGASPGPPPPPLVESA